MYILILKGLTRHWLRRSVLVLLLLSNYRCLSQSVPDSYQIGTWRGFRSAAISYTFDDNCSNQLAIAVPMFNQFNFNLTLFTVVNWSPNWSGLQGAAARGNEIGSHTMSHPYLDSLSDSLQLTELQNSQSIINAHINGQKCTTVAYPYCAEGNAAMISQYYIAARGCQGYIEAKTPRDFMNISSIICGAVGSVKTGADFKTNADNAVKSNGWCVYLIHGIDNDGGYSPLSSDTLRASLQYLSANPEKFWVSTFGNVVKYIKERNSAKVSEIANQEDTIVVQLTDSLNDSLFDLPLTVRRQLPKNWSSADVYQNGKQLNSQIVKVDSLEYVIFDVIPNSGSAVLVGATTVGMKRQHLFDIPSSTELLQNYPNPFNPSTIIDYQIPAASHVTLKVHDSIGREVATLVNETQNAGYYNVTFNADCLPSGVYLYRIASERFSTMKELVLVKKKS